MAARCGTSGSAPTLATAWLNDKDALKLPPLPLMSMSWDLGGAAQRCGTPPAHLQRCPQNYGAHRPQQLSG